MPTTKIEQVSNETSKKLLFVKLEDRKNNRYLHSGGSDTDVDDCTVPWVNNEHEFREKTIIITTVHGTPELIGYIYQHKDDDGDWVRYSTDGYKKQGTQLIEAGGEINLTVSGSGGTYTVRATKVDRG